jgi:hypothetical protein
MRKDKAWLMRGLETERFPVRSTASNGVAKIRILSSVLASGRTIHLILKFPENREFNREFLRIRGHFGLPGAISRSHFNALQANSLRPKEQGIFSREQGIHSS